MTYSESLSKLGNAVVIVDFADTAYKNDKAYKNGEMSYAQSAYNTITHGISVTAGAAVSLAVSGMGATGSFGAATIPAIAGGIALGAATSNFSEWVFDKMEEQIWGEAK